MHRSVPQLPESMPTLCSETRNNTMVSPEELRQMTYVNEHQPQGRQDKSSHQETCIPETRRTTSTAHCRYNNRLLIMMLHVFSFSEFFPLYCHTKLCGITGFQITPIVTPIWWQCPKALNQCDYDDKQSHRTILVRSICTHTSITAPYSIYCMHAHESSSSPSIGT